MKTKFLIIAGAGCTLSDSRSGPLWRRPPLDSGFFSHVEKHDYSELKAIKRYLISTYDFNPTDPERDSLEAVMSVIYADIHNPILAKKAIGTFRDLIRLFNKHIAETTNNLEPSNRFNLYRILCKALDDGIAPEEITVITFNQDIQIEKMLHRLQTTRRAIKHGGIFFFPNCYKIPDSHRKLSAPPDTVSTFQISESDNVGIRLLKLHGSLNWFSTHNTRNISKQTILSSKKPYLITPRTKLAPNLTMTGGNLFAFPLVVPPVTHKAGILHKDIHPLWHEAEVALKSSKEVVVLGYSCPVNDFESANLIRRSIRSNKTITDFNIIDPNPQVFQRYVDLTQLDRIYYFKNSESYVKSWDDIH